MICHDKFTVIKVYLFQTIPVEDVLENLSGPVVEITDGLLVGTNEVTNKGTRYSAFRGIPFAEPPLGELRFAVSPTIEY